jgi:hypothetical protein
MDKTWALKSWQNFFPTTWRMKMSVKGGGRMELWSRYFHQMLALLDHKNFETQIKYMLLIKTIQK